MDERKQIKLQKAAAILKNPVLWAKACLRTVDNASKKIVPWEARWYQAEMLLSNAVKKVARCGRRTGGILPVPDKLLECYKLHLCVSRETIYLWRISSEPCLAMQYSNIGAFRD